MIASYLLYVITPMALDVKSKRNNVVAGGIRPKKFVTIRRLRSVMVCHRSHAETPPKIDNIDIYILSIDRKKFEKITKEPLDFLII